MSKNKVTLSNRKRLSELQRNLRQAMAKISATNAFVENLDKTKIRFNEKMTSNEVGEWLRQTDKGSYSDLLVSAEIDGSMLCRKDTTAAPLVEMVPQLPDVVAHSILRDVKLATECTEEDSPSLMPEEEKDLRVILSSPARNDTFQH